MFTSQEYGHGVQINLYIRDLDNLFPEDSCSEFIVEGFKSLSVEHRGEKRIPATQANIAFISRFLDTYKDKILSLYASDAKFELLESCPRWSTVEISTMDGFINYWNIYLEHSPIVDPIILSNLTTTIQDDFLTKLKTAGFDLHSSKHTFVPLFLLTQRNIRNTAKGLEVFQDYKLTLPIILRAEDLNKLKDVFKGDMRKRLKLSFSLNEKDQKTEIDIMSRTYINEIKEI